MTALVASQIIAAPSARAQTPSRFACVHMALLLGEAPSGFARYRQGLAYKAGPLSVSQAKPEMGGVCRIVGSGGLSRYLCEGSAALGAAWLATARDCLRPFEDRATASQRFYRLPFFPDGAVAIEVRDRSARFEARAASP